eukprot:8075292-Karenia_brevis.AAC.1
MPLVIVPSPKSTNDKKDSHMMYMSQAILFRARATGAMIISGRAYKDKQIQYEASTDKYHTDKKLIKIIAANAWNFLSLVLGLQNVAYYGT